MDNMINSSAPVACIQSYWQNRPIALIYAIHGLPYVLLYVPCLLVMLRKPLRNNICYQIMAYIGVLDLFGLVASAFLPAAMSWWGTAWCHPSSLQFGKIATALGFGVWMSYGVACQLLAVNRLAIMFKPDLIRIYFGQKPVLLYMLTIIGFGSAMAGDNYMAPSGFLYDPRLGFYVPQQHTSAHLRFTYTVFNLELGTFLVVVYVCILYKLRKTSTLASAHANQSQSHVAAMELSVTVQSVLICVLTTLAAFGYVLMPQLRPQPLLCQLTQITWQAVHGTAPLVYLALNQSVRRQILKLIGLGMNNRAQNI